MAGDPVAGSASGLPGRGGQRQLLDQVQDFAGQPGRQAGHPGDELAGRGQDDFRPAGADRLDDLAGGPLGVHRRQRQAGAEREPGELLSGLPGETGLQVGAGAHQPGHDGGDRHRAAAEFGAQPFGEADGGELGGAVGQQVRDAELAADRRDRDDPAMALAPHDRQRGEREADGGQRHGLHRVLVVAELRRLHRANLDDPGIADHDVEAAVALERGVDQALRRGLVGQVAGDRRHLGARGAQLARRAVQLGGIAGADDQRAAVPGELAGQQQAEAPGPARHHRHLATDIVARAVIFMSCLRDLRTPGTLPRRPAGKQEIPRPPRWNAGPAGQGTHADRSQHSTT